MDGIARAKGDELTARVSVLFHLLGFATWDIGLTEGEFPDVIAYPSSSDWILTIECSSKSDEITRKLMKLASRTRQIGTGLSDISVIPLYFTNLRKNAIIASDFDTAATERISMITLEDLNEFKKWSIPQQTPKRSEPIFCKEFQVTNLTRSEDC